MYRAMSRFIFYKVPFINIKGKALQQAEVPGVEILLDQNSYLKKAILAESYAAFLRNKIHYAIYSEENVHIFMA